MLLFGAEKVSNMPDIHEVGGMVVSVLRKQAQGQAKEYRLPQKA
jgi:hypothetical protein